ncbi:MAG: aconitate hydratase AcnA [Pseudomonadota bacterium]|jgi:aconitate hydratase
MSHNLFSTLQHFTTGAGKQAKFYSLPALEQAGLGAISKLPVSIRIVLESVLRNCDGQKVEERNVRELAAWKAKAERNSEIPFVVARVLLQDFTGVPLGVDLAAMRAAVKKLGKNPQIIEPLVPVDLVIDHSVQVDYSNRNNALQLNMETEFERNHSRYQFLKWCKQAFTSFSVVPPGFGICHQVNLEYLAQGVLQRDGVYFPDTLVGTDSHTTMINGLGVVGWGVGGIEAEAAMLGQPVYFLTPDVVGFHMHGKLAAGVTATDLVLHVTNVLRKAKVVGKFVEFFGEGAESIPVTDRATIANMAPEYGATMGFFPVDERTCDYLTATGRSKEQVDTFRNYYKAQGLFGIPKRGECDYSEVIDLDLSSVKPNIAGPKRPQDKIELDAVKRVFTDLITKPVADGGYGKAIDELDKTFAVSVPTAGVGSESSTTLDTNVHHGEVFIAAITSCTNTSNPSVMLAAGLLAKKAVERGLKVKPFVKTSLAPGSRVVTEYLTKTGLQKYLDMLGFQVVGYGCTTCIGNSGPLDAHIEECITKNDMVGAAVLSGNRNFEARVHQNIKANFLMSPPLVVAYALAGTVRIDFAHQPIGVDSNSKPVFLKDIWPSADEILQLIPQAFDAAMYRKLYSNVTAENPLWDEIPASTGVVYEWDQSSTYIQHPPYFEGFSLTPPEQVAIRGARALAIFGDSVTTDHISPAGAIKKDSPAGTYLINRGVAFQDFNSYGARRGSHDVMVRGTFANVRIKNLMVAGVEGGVTVHQPSGERLTIYDAAVKYAESRVPLVVFAGQEYGTGSSRDWAAKGTMLLGVKAVIAESFERIHRSNLIGMGVLPCQFKSGESAKSHGISGTEEFEIRGTEHGITPGQDVTLVVRSADGSTKEITVKLRVDTSIEVEYFKHGGILPYVLRSLVSQA